MNNAAKNIYVQEFCEHEICGYFVSLSYCYSLDTVSPEKVHVLRTQSLMKAEFRGGDLGD
jgi:hypothetical protein